MSITVKKIRCTCLYAVLKHNKVFPISLGNNNDSEINKRSCQGTASAVSRPNHKY